MKVSLHGSGNWHHSFVNDAKAARWLSAGARRHVDNWSRPPEMGPGFTRGYAITIPASELRLWPPDAEEVGNVQYLPPPSVDQATQIEVVLVEPTNPPATLEVEAGILVADLAIGGGGIGRVVVLARLLDWPENMQRHVEYLKSVIQESDVLDLDTLLQAKAQRIALFGFQGDGTRVAIDAAAPGR